MDFILAATKNWIISQTMDWNHPYHSYPDPERDMPQEPPKGSQDPNIWPQPTGPQTGPFHNYEPLPDFSDSTSCSTSSESCYTTSNASMYSQNSWPMATPYSTAPAYSTDHNEFPFYQESEQLCYPPMDPTGQAGYSFPTDSGQYIWQLAPYPQENKYANAQVPYTINSPPAYTWISPYWQTPQDVYNPWQYANIGPEYNNSWEFLRAAPPAPEFVMPAPEPIYWQPPRTDYQRHNSDGSDRTVIPATADPIPTYSDPATEVKEPPRTPVTRLPELSQPPQPSTAHSEPNTWVCPIQDCNKTFEQRHKLNKHIKSHNRLFACHYRTCNFSAYQKKDVKRHVEAVHRKVKIFCPIANCRYSKDGPRKGICRKDALKRHLASHGLDADLYMSRHESALATSAPQENQELQWNSLPETSGTVVAPMP